MGRNSVLSLVAVALVLPVAGCSSSTPRSAVGTYTSRNNPRALDRAPPGWRLLRGPVRGGNGRPRELGAQRRHGDTEFSDGSVARAELQGDYLVFPEDSLIGFDCGTHWRKKD